MKNLALLLLVSCCYGQDLDLQLVKPDPNNGRPVLIQVESNWEIPIRVYTDNDIEHFITKLDLTLAARTFAKNGKYFIRLFSYYKNNSVCRTWVLPNETLRRTPEFQKECHLVGYRVRWIDVDTRAGTMTVTRANLLDTNGVIDIRRDMGIIAHPAPFRLDHPEDPMGRTIINITNLVREEEQRDRLVSP